MDATLSSAMLSPGDERWPRFDGRRALERGGDEHLGAAEEEVSSRMDTLAVVFILGVVVAIGLLFAASLGYAIGVHKRGYPKGDEPDTEPTDERFKAD